ncbi:hypothetical protein HN031_18620 [Nocardioides sp. zg-1308]|uniref:hypothetical protein n=1 Tax=Nocardioides TaxID=1839 RepID=UPI0015535517|nr:MULTISPECIES: hypothetical protein [unclassified Nocardioides]NPD06691.1 hypothetical protein [Nocardioides sp. zg-1308]WQQ20957.1 hypothetical protein SHK17_13715 [Nocardioides sp. S-34]
MTGDRTDRTDLAAVEQWFVDHGLPYFVDDIRAEVQRGLARGRLVRVGLLAVVLAAAVVCGFALTDHLEWDDGLVPGINLGLLSVALYALFTLRAWVVARWAASQTFSSLGLLFPLVTRALPLLLLFVTFLFINAEVWEVSATLDGRVMWLTVALFLTITVGFLLVRLPEELAGFDEHVDPDELARHLVGTPLEGFRQPAGAKVVDEVAISGLQKANLVLMLLITQLVQVVLLSVSVFVFFVVFGLLVMDPGVIAGWIGHEVTNLPFSARANWELVQVSTFLAAFSGLYFTVYAVTDEVYRTQFFSSIVAELERAVSVRAAYRALRRTD